MDLRTQFKDLDEKFNQLKDQKIAIKDSLGHHSYVFSWLNKSNKSLENCINIEKALLEKGFKLKNTPGFFKGYYGSSQLTSSYDYLNVSYQSNDCYFSHYTVYLNLEKGKMYIIKSKDGHNDQIIFELKSNSFNSISVFLDKVDEVFNLKPYNSIKDTQDKILIFLKNTLLKNTVFFIKQTLIENEFFDSVVKGNYSFYSNEIKEIKIPSTANINYESGIFSIKNSKDKELLKINFPQKMSYEQFIEKFNNIYFVEKTKVLKKYESLEKSRINSLNELISNIQNLV